MKFLVTAALILTLGAPLGLAKDKKKHTLPAVFSTAQYVYVQAEDGDIINPNLFPEDRNAIADVQDALHDWNRYYVTLHREDADLVIIVRKGRLAAAQVRGGVGVGNDPMGGDISIGHRAPGSTDDPGANRTGTVAMAGARTEAGPSEDTFRVFMMSPNGKLVGPIWSREIRDGLDAPANLIVKQLKDAVERDYPSQPSKATNQPAASKKP